MGLTREDMLPGDILANAILDGEITRVRAIKATMQALDEETMAAVEAAVSAETKLPELGLLLVTVVQKALQAYGLP